MNDIWIKAIVLVLVFAAVAFAVERVLAGYIGRRIESRAINQRLDLIGPTDFAAFLDSTALAGQENVSPIAPLTRDDGHGRD